MHAYVALRLLCFPIFTDILAFLSIIFFLIYFPFPGFADVLLLFMQLIFLFWIYSVGAEL